jgi:predicted Zn finger-like uncharacterized protein
MRITCPNCTSGFDIPTELLGRRGRTLKCATCGHGWFQAAVVNEIDLAEVMKESAEAEKPKEFGGTPSSRKNLPDTAAIAAAANEAFTQAFGKPPPKVERPAAPPPPPPPPTRPTPQPPPGQSGQPPAVPPGARSIMSRRNNQYQQTASTARSMLTPEQAASEAMAGSSLLEPDQAIDALQAQSLMGGQTGGPGAPGQSVMGQDGDAAAPAMGMDAAMDPLQQGVAGGAPGAQMVQRGGEIVQDSGESNPLLEQVAQQPPRDPSAWLNQDPDADDVLGVAGMPGMPGASGMPGAPGGAASGLPPAWSESLMNRDPMQGPGAAAVSQLTGDQIQAPGQAARSMLTGNTIDGPGLGSQSMLTGERSGPGAPGASQMGQAGGPGAAGVSQMGGDIDGPGQGSVSLLDGSQHDAQARADGGANAEGGVAGGPGAAGGASGELVEDGAEGIEDDLFESEDGAADDNDLDGGVEGGISGGPGAGSGDEDADSDTDSDKEDEDDELVDPDEDTPDFAALTEEDDVDDLDDDPLAGFEEAPPRKPKKKKKKIDPAYVTAAVLFIIVCLLGSMLYVGRDQLSAMWPALKGVYEALNVEETPGEGLRLSQPQPSRMIIGGVQTLIVNGFITNLTDGAQPVPNVKLMLVDDNNNIVQETSSPPSSSTIDPNSSIPYRIELQLPVDSATGILVEFD